MTKPIIFYDIPSTLKNVAWSPYTWKTRYVLNFKGIPYKTVWVEYPDIAPKMKEIGAKPTDKKDGEDCYTLPVIQDPNTGAILSDSFDIAEYLEKKYPDTPKLFPVGSEGLQAAFDAAHVNSIPIPRLIVKKVFSILNPASQGYFRTTREKRRERTIESMDEGAEQQWQTAQAGYSKFAEWYDKNGTGPFIQGDSLTYADIILAGHFAWYGFVAGRDSEEWKNMLTWDGGRWARLMDALKPYESTEN